jgi:hypothetical protein
MENREEVRLFKFLNIYLKVFITNEFLGSKFDVYIKVETSPQHLLITYPNAIKVTVDGPRPPRCKS